MADCVSAEIVSAFHDRLLADFPWWSSGIRWEVVPGAVAVAAEDLHEPCVTALVRSVFASVQRWILVVDTENPARVRDLAEVGDLSELVKVPITAFLVGVHQLADRSWQLNEEAFLGVAFRVGRWEVGSPSPGARSCSLVAEK